MWWRVNKMCCSIKNTNTKHYFGSGAVEPKLLTTAPVQQKNNIGSAKLQNRKTTYTLQKLRE